MGPLEGLRVVELSAIGPLPHAGMILADLGAEVALVLRPGEAASLGGRPDVSRRGRLTVAADLKDRAQREEVLDLIGRSDVLLEGLRPGVAERLGLGPAQCLARNPRLIYGRMTGWGQDGTPASTAGHDINPSRPRHPGSRAPRPPRRPSRRSIRCRSARCSGDRMGWPGPGCRISRTGPRRRFPGGGRARP